MIYYNIPFDSNWNSSRVEVAKSISSLLLFFQIFPMAKKLVTYWIWHSYLTGVTTAQLVHRYHSFVSHLVIQYITRCDEEQHISSPLFKVWYHPCTSRTLEWHLSYRTCNPQHTFPRVPSKALGLTIWNPRHAAKFLEVHSPLGKLSPGPDDILGGL